MFGARNMSRPLYEQSPLDLDNVSTTACSYDPSDHPEVLAEKAEGRAFLETLPLGAPRDSAESQALHLCTNGDVLLGRATNGVCPCDFQPATGYWRRGCLCVCARTCISYILFRCAPAKGPCPETAWPLTSECLPTYLLGCAPGQQASRLVGSNAEYTFHHAISDTRLVQA